MTNSFGKCPWSFLTYFPLGFLDRPWLQRIWWPRVILCGAIGGMMVMWTISLGQRLYVHDQPLMAPILLAVILVSILMCDVILMISEMAVLIGPSRMSAHALARLGLERVRRPHGYVFPLSDIERVRWCFKQAGQLPIRHVAHPAMILLFHEITRGPLLAAPQLEDPLVAWIKRSVSGDHRLPHLVMTLLCKSAFVLANDSDKNLREIAVKLGYAALMNPDITEEMRIQLEEMLDRFLQKHASLKGVIFGWLATQHVSQVAPTKHGNENLSDHTDS